MVRSLLQVQSKLCDTGNIGYKQVLDILGEIFHLPNPALILIPSCPIVWTACLACHVSGKPVQVTELVTSLLSNSIIAALIYSTFCTLDKIIDLSHDENRPRNLFRTTFLIFVHLCRVIGATASICYFQEVDSVVTWLPCFTVGSLCNLVKRSKVLEQVSLASAVALILIPTWISGGRKIEWSEDLILLGFFTMFWIIYIQVLYDAMDGTNSAKPYSNYLSLSLATHLALTFLSLLQISALFIYSYQSEKSPHFWILGVGIWVVNNVWHISDLRNVDWLWNEMSGRVAVQRNIWLGLWLCGAEICELWIRGGLVF